MNRLTDDDAMRRDDLGRMRGLALMAKILTGFVSGLAITLLVALL